MVATYSYDITTNSLIAKNEFLNFFLPLSTNQHKQATLLVKTG